VLIKKDKIKNKTFSLSLFAISQADILSKKEVKKNAIFRNREFLII
jgi:hypothetical protein